MPENLSEPLKAILLKVAMELKKLRWRPNTQTNEIDVFQGHLGMSKEYLWEGDGDNPDVNVDINIDMTLQPNEQNGVYFLVYKASYSMWVEGVGGNDREEDSDIATPFTQQDVNNMAKFVEAAQKINSQVMQAAEEHAYEYAQQSSQGNQNYNSQKGWQEPEDNV